MTVKTHMYALIALGVIAMMIAPGEALSKRFFDGDTAHVIPYDEGDFVRYPEPAGSIVFLGCRHTYKGALLTFKIDVFEEAWRPVYAIEITGLHDNEIEPVDWPAGWAAEEYPQAYEKGGERISFYTESNPIEPGSELGGFTLLSNSNRAVIRWYATGKSGMMLGRVERIVFTCHTATAPGTWGSIKAMYK